MTSDAPIPSNEDNRQFYKNTIISGVFVTLVTLFMISRGVFTATVGGLMVAATVTLCIISFRQYRKYSSESSGDSVLRFGS
jgi:hypothetical protein